MAQISVRVDDETKRLAESVCDDIGISMSTAINIYLKKLSRERRIPFDVSADPFYSEENMKRLQRAVNDLNAGKGKIHEVDYD
ncbi:MAG: type II toxin-antitoxin system RelB/DinJ family antitoxin [Ruminococcus sp.]|nr:type II toxin-antitoxin system RelB/DinJ family antitoxin [Ruminococcus sp.]MCD7727512.1 type II toxin-antitoxin system RelB/DinJ family antitoxin [Ruminococcus sp.]MCD8327836.1 type II toxin-antitoxin system RelB/DinJ family antitoxin [Ruminococcus sp.]